MLLPVTVNAAIALFHPIWVPRDFVMNELPAVVLQIDAFGCSIRREQNADRRFGWVGLKRRLNAFTVLQCHATVNSAKAVRTTQIFGCEQVMEPLLRSSILREENYAMVGPLAGRLERVVQPLNQPPSLRVRAACRVYRELAQLFE